MAKIDIYEEQWCDLVFTDRNTSFGAYVLRTESSKRHLKALIIASIAFLLAIASPILIKTLTPKADDSDTRVREITYVDPNANKEKKQEEIKLPPPPVEKVLSTVAFPPPVIKKDEEVAEEANLMQQTVLNTDKAIGTEDVQGNTNDANEVPVNTIDNTVVVDKVFEVVEVVPQFPGGMDALYEYLRKNVNYPVGAKEMGVQGRVIVQFVVGKDGQIREVKVVKGVDPLLDAEAERVIKTMPKWNPGRQGNQAVSVRYTMPVVFIIQE